MSEKNDFDALGIDLIAGGGIRFEYTDEGLVISSTAHVELGDIVGEFTRDTVILNAFEQGNLIFYDDGSRFRVYRASADIPKNSRLPTQNGSLWRQVPTSIGGISQEQLDAALQRYVTQIDFDNEVRTTDSDILGLQNQIDQNDNALANVPTNQELVAGLQSVVTAERQGRAAAISNLATLLRGEREGVELRPRVTQVVFNLMRANPDYNQSLADNTPTFTRVGNLYQKSERDEDISYLSRYDHFLFTIHLAAETTGNPSLIKTQFVMDYNDWFELKALPSPTQSAYQDATIQDNRAMTFYWEVGGVDRTIYIGRTTESNSRLTYAIRGWRGQVRMEVRGYRGAT